MKGLRIVVLVGLVCGSLAAASMARAQQDDDVRCMRREVTIVGTNGRDHLMGTPGDDVIAGLGGRDRINGQGGDDVICGDDGSDDIDGSEGSDLIWGAPGRDRISGGEGADHLFGGSGNDALHGDAGRDLLAGGPAASGDWNEEDWSTGGEGDDLFVGAFGKDLFLGGAGSDSISYSPLMVVIDLDRGIAISDTGGIDSFESIENAFANLVHQNEGGDPLIRGTEGSNVIVGSGGPDHLLGLGGTDLIDGWCGADRLVGGNDFDVAAWGCEQGIQANLDTGEAVGIGNTDVLLGFEGLGGSPGWDELVGDSSGNLLFGGRGNDSLFGSGGDDFLFGATGEDASDGGDGEDRCMESEEGRSCEKVRRALTDPRWKTSLTLFDLYERTLQRIGEAGFMDPES